MMLRMRFDDQCSQRVTDALTRIGLALAAAGVVLLIAGCGGAEKGPNDGNAAQETERVEAITAASAPKRVWLDVDPAIGLERSEVDDGVFLLQSFHSPEMEIAGVSVVFGNTSLENGLPIARDLVERFGPPGLTVAEGAARADQLFEDTPAVRAMVEALKEEPLSLLAVGPVTNAATLVRNHPELHERIEQIVMVAGRRVGQRFEVTKGGTALRDFNFELDPVAMQVLLDSEIPLVFAPWEVSSHVWVREADLDDLADRSEAGAWMAEATRSWLGLWRENFGVDGFNPFDTLAAAWITHPQLLEHFEGFVWIEQGEDDTQPGSGSLKPYLHVSAEPSSPSKRRAVYLFEPDPEFHDILKQRIAGPVDSDGGRGV